MRLQFVRSRDCRAAPPVMKRWESALDLSQPGVKTYETVRTGDVVSDYRHVRIKGYLSTFGTVDRQGDYVEPGAFAETLQRFRLNPVLLADHTNRTQYLSGSFTLLREDARGLYVEGRLSDAPDVQSVRFKVVEGHLRTLSMGGVFHYRADDRRRIYKVDLWEGSLTPIPANQDALLSVRSLTDIERRFVKSGALSFHDFLAAQRAQNQPGIAACNAAGTGNITE